MVRRLRLPLFSDLPNDRIPRWTPDGGISAFRRPSGFVSERGYILAAARTFAPVGSSKSQAPIRIDFLAI
jgi:hypothetical protein